MLNRFTKALVEATDATEFGEPWGLGPDGSMLPYGPPSMLVTVRRKGLRDWKAYLKDNDLDPELEFGRIALRAQLDVNAEVMANSQRKGMRQPTKKQMQRKIRAGLEEQVEKAMSEEISEEERQERLVLFQQGICDLLIEGWRAPEPVAPGDPEVIDLPVAETLPEWSSAAGMEMWFNDVTRNADTAFSSEVPTRGYDPERPYRIGWTDKRFATPEELVEAAQGDAPTFLDTLRELEPGEMLQASPRLILLHERDTTTVPYGGQTAAEALTFWLLTCAEHAEAYRATRMESVLGN